MEKYIKIRMENTKIDFSHQDIRMIDENVSRGKMTYNSFHPLVNHNPMSEFQNKGQSDDYAVRLWNDIMDVPNISRIDQIPASARLQMGKIDHTDPNITESDFIKYSTAFAHSSFFGIQNPSKSRYALDSFKKTLDSHCSGMSRHRPWIIPCISDIVNYVETNPKIMKTNYADVCLNAKMSSTSIKGAPKFRDFVFTHTLDDIKEYIKRQMYTDKLYVAGVRNDRRGKYRLIFSLSGVMRVLDFYINHGSYKVFHSPEFSDFVTEGDSESQNWAQMKDMSKRGQYLLVCLDYSGYDTQISQYDYADISYHLNKHRLEDKSFRDIFSFFYNWMIQPKMLITKEEGELKILIPKVSSLASGLHGTHSFENIIGYATYKYLQSKGCDIKRVWLNGDDQNFLVYKHHVDKFMKIINEEFIISEPKSLVGSVLGVWSRLWFTSKYYPSPEIGTFRSLWEKESGSNEMVEESKISSNYSKIISIAIMLIRLNKTDEEILSWIHSLCRICVPQINPNLLPISLEGLHTKSGSGKETREPTGLNSSKDDLQRINAPFKLLNVPNYYSMLYTMYTNRHYFSMEPKHIKYTRSLTIYANLDYSDKDYIRVPWMFKLLKKIETSNDVPLIRSILQSTHSYDGPVPKQYYVTNMLELAKAINHRNRLVWSRK